MDADTSGRAELTLDLGDAASADVLVTTVASGRLPITTTIQVMAGQPYVLTVALPPKSTTPVPEIGAPGGPDHG